MVLHVMQASGYADPEEPDVWRRGDASSKMATFPKISAQLLEQVVADYIPLFFLIQLVG
jgi:hypothetical protein